jgi:hypothetical protein
MKNGGQFASTCKFDYRLSGGRKAELGVQADICNMRKPEE